MGHEESTRETFARYRAFGTEDDRGFAFSVNGRLTLARRTGKTHGREGPWGPLVQGRMLEYAWLREDPQLESLS